MGAAIKFLAQKNSINHNELIEFAKNNNTKYDVWCTNGEYISENPRGMVQAFKKHKHIKAFEKIECICEQMMIPISKIRLSGDNVEIVGFSEMAKIDSYLFVETISLFEMMGYRRDMNKSRDIFWKF